MNMLEGLQGDLKNRVDIKRDEIEMRIRGDVEQQVDLEKNSRKKEEIRSNRSIVKSIVQTK